MQGRLSPVVDGKIQSFPWDTWEREFKIAHELDFSLMEWTLDQECLYENPLMTDIGALRIQTLCKSNDVQVLSVTADCFMHAPFWKVFGLDQIKLKEDFLAVVSGCERLGAQILVVPLVDNGRLDNLEQEDLLVEFLQSNEYFFIKNKVRIAFESDYDSFKLARFIERLNPLVFGINYDIGNSAALGFDPQEEFLAYGKRIINVHVKDRELGGTTVQLGSGAAKFDAVFKGLSRLGYDGNFILQAARALDGDHAKKISIYRNQTLSWLKAYDF